MDEKYKEYLRSEEWRNKARQFKFDKNYKCEICGNLILIEVIKIIKDPMRLSANIEQLSRFIETIEEKNWEIYQLIIPHHKTYKNIYHEKQEDLVCLCHPCHTFIHEATKGNQREEGWGATVKKVNNLLKEIDRLDKMDLRPRKIDFTGGWIEDPNPEFVFPAHLFPEITEDEIDWESSDDPIEM